MSIIQKFSGTVANGETATIPIAMSPYASGFQLSVEGAGTVAIATQESGNAAYVDQTTISEGSLIFDLQAISNVQLTAAGADMDYVLRIRAEFVSTPEDNWQRFPAGATS